MEWDEGVIHQGLIAKLRNSNHITVLTGAGISAESGVPTFRQAQTGLWAQYDPQQLATPQAFRRNPRLVWEWYSWRRELVTKAEPNPGHITLVTMEKLVPIFSLITQNVDDLHQRAGSQNIIALHGNILRTRCFDCHAPADNIRQLPNSPLNVPFVVISCDQMWFGLVNLYLQLHWRLLSQLRGNVIFLFRSELQHWLNQQRLYLSLPCRMTSQ
jgi:NAD-dependent deacetylase